MKKLIILIIFTFTISLNSAFPECKSPKKPKEKIVYAPEIISYARINSGNRIDKVLSNRKTINVFRAWNSWTFKSYNYGLTWGVSLNAQNPWGFSLQEILWAYTYPFKGHYGQVGMDRFMSKRKWGSDSWKEYGKTYHVNYTDPEFEDYMANLIKGTSKGIDGIMFDLWKDNHKWAGGKSKKIVQKHRYKISKRIREEMGRDFIILGNINWEKERVTHEFINGVFLELWKKKKSGYSCEEIKKIGDLLKYHDKHLSYPKLIALNPWKISKQPSKKIQKEYMLKKFGKEVDIKKFNKKYWIQNYRSSPKNMQFAKLFTAMAMVIPENGYILYGDNNHDNPSNDHHHEFYDFYHTDLGKEISIGMEIADGLGLKMYQKGLIAYNYTKYRYKIILKNGKAITIEPVTGLFVEFE